jgi:2-polyprenyl-6-methoxyphenol hydroxylase-like FAD-dependent oxidoreductase
MSHKLDILIVGAGLSGLAAAIQCALSGHSVTVLEGARELAEVCVHAHDIKPLHSTSIFITTPDRRWPSINT